MQAKLLFQGHKSQSITLGSSDAAISSILSGKTLAQVANENQLTTEDVDFKASTIPNTNVKAVAVVLNINGARIAIPTSKGYLEWMENASDEQIADSMFRATFKAKKDDKGNVILNEDGSPELDETKPYLTFGKPSGISYSETVRSFSETVAVA